MKKLAISGRVLWLCMLGCSQAALPKPCAEHQLPPASQPGFSAVSLLSPPRLPTQKMGPHIIFQENKVPQCKIVCPPLRCMTRAYGNASKKIIITRISLFVSFSRESMGHWGGIHWYRSVDWETSIRRYIESGMHYCPRKTIMELM
jgi:hypothetical protein